MIIEKKLLISLGVRSNPFFNFNRSPREILVILAIIVAIRTVMITNDLTLDLTVNPDFGQVEADPGAIALDGFQIFFREQRPFFVENSNIFDYQFANGSDNVFYSRRIGRNPHRSANLANGEFSDELKLLDKIAP